MAKTDPPARPRPILAQSLSSHRVAIEAIERWTEVRHCQLHRLHCTLTNSLTRNLQRDELGGQPFATVDGDRAMEVPLVAFLYILENQSWVAVRKPYVL